MLNRISDFLRLRQKRLTVPLKIGTEPVLNLKEGEVAVVTYTSAADKMKVFAAFIREGIENGDQIEYIYPDEENETVRAKLKEYGIDVEKYEKNGTLIMRSLTEHLMPDGKFDKERAIKEGLDRRAEAQKKGYKHYRDFHDVGDFSFLKGQWQIYFDFWDDPGWGVPSGSGVGILYEPFLIELTAVNVERMSETMVKEILRAFGGGKYPTTRLIDLLEYADAFSKRIDVPHQELLGRKILMEFDPTCDYEEIVEDFAKEALANLEPTYIFTSSNSTVHQSLAEQRTIKFFLMSISASTPKTMAENEIVLPAQSTSLILDSLNKILETHTSANVFLVFDNLSELLMSVGFDSVYKFLIYAMDILFSEKITALFLLNPSAHEPTVVSRIRGLFSNILIFERNRLSIRKRSLNS